jgi:hypothetical protein
VATDHRHLPRYRWVTVTWTRCSTIRRPPGSTCRFLHDALGFVLNRPIGNEYSLGPAVASPALAPAHGLALVIDLAHGPWRSSGQRFGASSGTGQCGRFRLGRSTRRPITRRRLRTSDTGSPTGSRTGIADGRPGFPGTLMPKVRRRDTLSVPPRVVQNTPHHGRQVRHILRLEYLHRHRLVRQTLPRSAGR